MKNHGQPEIELSRFKLDSALSSSNVLFNLSEPNATCWSGIADIQPYETLSLNSSRRNDIFVLQGEVCDRALRWYREGTYLYCGSDLFLFTAGEQGARLLLYSDALLVQRHAYVTPKSHRTWNRARVEGMSVALLSDIQHTLTLVTWSAGTHVNSHIHPNGEDIFVISGQLNDEYSVLPAGSWVRLYPGSSHAPYAAEATVILLRNGHLRETYSPFLRAPQGMTRS